jgi:hypothetical protein
MSINSDIVEILEMFWPKNKAKGLLAQTIFNNEILDNRFGSDAAEKFMSGCWLLAPKNEEFYKFRFSFFIHPRIMAEQNAEQNIKDMLEDKYRPFHAVTEFMDNAGVGVIYCTPYTKDGKIPSDDLKNKKFESLNWKFSAFCNGKFIQKHALEFFELWEGSRGRPSHGNAWTESVKNEINGLDISSLTDMLLNEMFYTGFVKGRLKKPLNDPYDVDAFMLSLSQKHIFPMEIKEKFPGQNRNEKFFGIDVGRIMMFLRICLPNDANAIYLIRELDEEGRFIAWKYITLSDIIMTSSWNLQAGGIGMGGQNTQTIRLPYSYFQEFNGEKLSEESLKELGSLPKDIKLLAGKFRSVLSTRFYSREGGADR